MTTDRERYSRALGVQRLRDEVSPIEQPRRFIEPWDWTPARNAAFCAMYGLPHNVGVALACKIIRRYLPVFDARLLDPGEVAGLARSMIYQVEEFIDGSSNGLAPLDERRHTRG